MKRLFTILFSLMLTVTLLAQNDVTTFLGIPVDGSKSEFIQKLKAKGFTMDYKLDMLTGKFNGEDVYVNTVENNGKVWRVGVFAKDPKTETQVRIAFNKLSTQFKNNPKYVEDDNNRMLDDDDEIGYGIRLYHKQYQNSYYQKNLSNNQGDRNKSVWFLINEITYGKYIICIMYDNKYNEAHGEDL